MATKTYDKTSRRPDRPVGIPSVFFAVLIAEIIVGTSETPTTIEILTVISSFERVPDYPMIQNLAGPLPSSLYTFMLSLAI